jgi:hypothetical protein
MSRVTALFDLPPTPPAYVEVRDVFWVSEAKQFMAALKDADREPPDGPHEHEHTDEGEGRGPIIRQIIPASARPGDTVTILGSGFGAVQGEGFVTIGSVMAPPEVS